MTKFAVEEHAIFKARPWPSVGQLLTAFFADSERFILKHSMEKCTLLVSIKYNDTLKNELRSDFFARTQEKPYQTA